MQQITPQMRILAALEAVDFRKGIDSLAELGRAKLNADPFSGCLFVFRGRRATSIKVLVYDGQGLWPATKRLSKGRFRLWPRVPTDHHSAAPWLGSAAPLFDVAKRPWLRDIVQSYAPWTFAANGLQLEAHEDVDQPPNEWNGSYFKLVAACLVGLLPEFGRRLFQRTRHQQSSSREYTR